MHINNLAVLPDFRHRGVGAELLAFVLNEGARLGALRATLEVRRSNTPALMLYERYGFTVAGIRRDYNTNPQEDALILWKDQLAVRTG